jgi:hypothetical protein
MMAENAPRLPPRVEAQIAKAGLPTGGAHPFYPELTTNRKGEPALVKAQAVNAPKGQSEKWGWVDAEGRIWVRDQAHAGVPDHWDVQITGGADYLRVDDNGEEIV